MPCRKLSLSAVVCACLIVAVAASADEIENARDAQRNLNAIQSVYRNGVPHTDKTGRPMMKYDPQKSFFQIGSWGVPLPGKVYGYEYDWKVLKTAGYNTAWTWGGVPKPSLAAGSKYGLQIVVMGEISDPDLAAVKDSPNLLGNVWCDEPIGALGTPKMDTMFADFTAYRSKVQRTAPHLPVFVNDAPWIMAPATSWWLKWDQAGDVSCQDNYPVMDHTARASSIGADPNGIPQSISLAAASSQEKKPVWLIVGAFEQPGEYGQAFPFRYPSPEQLRMRLRRRHPRGYWNRLFHLGHLCAARWRGSGNVSQSTGQLCSESPAGRSDAPLAGHAHANGKSQGPLGYGGTDQ